MSLYLLVAVVVALPAFQFLDIKGSTVPGRPSFPPATCTVAFFFCVMFLSPGHRFTSANELFPSRQSLAAIAAVRIFSASCLRAPSSVVRFVLGVRHSWSAAGAAPGDLSHCSLIAPLRLGMHQQ